MAVSFHVISYHSKCAVRWTAAGQYDAIQYSRAQFMTVLYEIAKGITADNTARHSALRTDHLLSYFERILTVSFLCASAGSTGAFSPLPVGSASVN
jgi:hypothetical protein